MIYSFSLTGANTPAIKEFDIEKNTAITSGTVVYIDQNGVVNKDGNGSVLGVAAEDHSGEKDILNSRANADKIRVDITLGGVYKMPCPVFEASENSDATSFVCESTDIDNSCKGYLVLVSKNSDSTNTDYCGKRRKITSVAVSGDKAVFALEEAGAACKGDKYAFVPATGFVGSIDESAKDFCASAASGNDAALTVVSCNTETLTIEAVLGSKLFN